MSDKVNKYEGKDADVVWDGRLCIHIGECGRASGELFVGGRKPWCQPDLVALGEVTDVVERCPTGALSYEPKDGGATEVADSQNTVTVVYNGPLYVRGDLAIDGAEDDMPGVKYRAALCRCGASKNKPFCDNSHEEAGFRDYGAVGQASENDDSGGTLTVKRAKNGPLLLSGNFEIRAASGRVAWRGTKAALCRCGQSKNKPFCDGAHAKAGFEAD
ncbi:MAG: CDGSH iron-sulfur domain-containing protein [Deltaproteobacteria bacterium]|nr:CDGSH iron-sulfur domain-containing protein [Deltaproteobacteria bacterium]